VSGPEHGFNQFDKAPIINLLLQQVDQDSMVDVVEVIFYVNVYQPLGRCPFSADFMQRRVTGSACSKAMRVV